MRLVVIAALMALAAPAVQAQAELDDASVHYVVERNAVLLSAADSTQPYANLGFREPVFVLENGGRWARVRTEDGAYGILPAESLSNIWIRVSKHKQTVFVYRGAELLARYPADLGYNFFADKEIRGSSMNPDDWRTPEGIFYVARKNPNSKFYRALVLNYPSREDAERGLRDSLITKQEYERVVRAESRFEMPPMNTALGGWIELHGDGTGRRANWTQGCIALKNEHLDELWEWAHEGTPVLVEP